MANEEAIKILKTLIPKTCKMVNGRLKGGFDNTECFIKSLRRRCMIQWLIEDMINNPQ